MDTVAFLIGLVGVVLNIYKRRVCFIMWMISGVLWAIVGVLNGIPGLVCQSCVYVALAVWGWVKWR